MKSKVMQQGATARFFEDVKLLAKMPEDAFREFVSECERQTAAGQQYAEEELLPIAARHNLVLDELGRAFRVAQFLFQHERDEDDPIDAVAEDLVKAEKLTADEGVRMVKRIRDCAPAFGGVLAEAEERDADIGMTFPTLEHLHTRCSIAVRFANEFNAPKGNPTDYSPEIEKVTPVVVLQMDIDKYGETETFVVGLPRHELDAMIAHLQFSKRQLEQIDKRVSA
jgi:hypothetical protein